MNTKNITIFEDLDLIEYKKAWDYQEQTMLDIQAKKEDKQNPPHHKLLFCEHPNVYTLGRSGAENNLLINDDFLKQINATYFKSNRGGDITYHGPGQIVAYPIFDLEQFGFGVKEYVYKLEQSIINMLALWDIKAERLEGATGVWLDAHTPGRARKICAMGVRVSRWVTMHGLAFNINTDLSYFNHINPCGFVDKGVTSMQKELGKSIDFELAKQQLKEEIKKEFNLEWL